MVTDTEWRHAASSEGESTAMNVVEEQARVAHNEASGIDTV
jgi:hypothetical protein